MLINEMKAIWRIVATVMIFQIVTGLLFIIVEKYGYWFIDFWFGGVLATPVGFIIGAYWQNISVDNSWENHKSIIIFFGLISILMILMLPFFPLEQMADTLKQNQ